MRIPSYRVPHAPLCNSSPHLCSQGPCGGALHSLYHPPEYPHTSLPLPCTPACAIQHPPKYCCRAREFLSLLVWALASLLREGDVLWTFCPQSILKFCKWGQTDWGQGCSGEGLSAGVGEVGLGVAASSATFPPIPVSLHAGLQGTPTKHKSECPRP